MSWDKYYIVVISIVTDIQYVFDYNIGEEYKTTKLKYACVKMVGNRYYVDLFTKEKYDIDCPKKIGKCFVNPKKDIIPVNVILYEYYKKMGKKIPKNLIKNALYDTLLEMNRELNEELISNKLKEKKKAKGKKIVSIEDYK